MRTRYDLRIRAAIDDPLLRFDHPPVLVKRHRREGAVIRTSPRR
jgi:hypothetical protein